MIQLNRKIISQEDSVNLSVYSSLSIRNIRDISAVDMFFFYRPKAGREEVTSTEDVQRFSILLLQEGRNSKYRLIMLGRKQVPEIVESKSTSEEGNWALNTLRQHIEYGTGNKRHGHPTAYTTTNEEIDNTAYAFIMRQEGIMYLLRGLIS